MATNTNVPHPFQPSKFTVVLFPALNPLTESEPSVALQSQLTPGTVRP
jgi:hypothetical protein